MEALPVDDQDAARLQVFEVRLEGCRVHGDQDIQVVTGGEDRKGGEVQLESADARQRPGRGADLGRKVRERREVIAGERRLGRELHAGDLHAVARVTREPDDDGVAFLDPPGTRGYPVRHLGTPPRPPWALNLLRVFAELRSKTRTPKEDSLPPGRLQLGRPRGSALSRLAARPRPAASPFLRCVRRRR